MFDCLILKKCIIRQVTHTYKKRRSATAIRHQGSPQANLLNGSAPRHYDEVPFTQ